MKDKPVPLVSLIVIVGCLITLFDSELLHWIPIIAAIGMARAYAGAMCK